MIATVNNHVLFPNACDWSQMPDWSREWQNEIAGATTGNESRTAMRSVPRSQITFLITLATLLQQSLFNDRVMAVKKSGLACCAYHGRGCPIGLAENGATEITVADNYAWQIGDYLFLGTEDDEELFEVRQLTAVDLTDGIWTLTFAGALTRDYAWMAWPVLFGKFIGEEFTPLTSRHGRMKVTIKELVSSRAAPIGAVEADTGTGIGHMIIGSTFIVA